MSGYYAVQAKTVFTAADDGLKKSWRGYGLVYGNPPWSEERRAIVKWLNKFNTEADGGIFVCVARTSADWFHQHVLPYADLLCFPAGKTRFNKPDGSPGPAPTNGIALIAKGDVACEALRRSGLGFCLTVDHSAAPSLRARPNGAQHDAEAPGKRTILSQRPTRISRAICMIANIRTATAST
jgi:hypothetical protein